MYVKHMAKLKPGLPLQGQRFLLSTVTYASRQLDKLHCLYCFAFFYDASAKHNVWSLPYEKNKQKPKNNNNSNNNNKRLRVSRTIPLKKYILPTLQVYRFGRVLFFRSGNLPSSFVSCIDTVKASSLSLIFSISLLILFRSSLYRSDD